MKIKMVITGGAGFIGSNLVRELVAQNYEVHVIDDLSGGKRRVLPQAAKLHRLDIGNIRKIAPIFKGAKYVFHLAAKPRVQFSIDDPISTFETNVKGTNNVLYCALKARVRRVVYSASSSAYGDQKQMPLVETMPTNPLSPYGLHKLAGELLCKMYTQVYELPTVSLRYFNVYGPGLDPNGAYALVIGRFLKLRKAGKPLTITGDGKQTRDFTHVRDVVRADLLAARSDKVGRGEVINIGAGNNHTINELAALIGGPVKCVPARIEPHDTLASNKLAQKLLGWRPEVKFEDGINELKRLFNIK